MPRSVETSVADPVFSGILDPDPLLKGMDPDPTPDPLFNGMGPDPEPSIIKQKYYEKP